ncbi:MAG: hypothetical protein AAF631_09805 [Pseudomonadota bacterium]
MTSFFAGRSPIAVSLICLAFVGGAIGLLSFLPEDAIRVVGVLGIAWGTVMIDRAIVSEERARPDGASNKLLLVLRAAIVLSAVSFATTLFGMLSFVAGSSEDGDIGRQSVGWFISLGTTFGIQFIMLIIALVLGERLIGLRPRFDDKIHKEFDDLEDDRPQNRNAVWLRVTLVPLAVLIGAVAAVMLGLFPAFDLDTALREVNLDLVFRISVGILLALLALGLLQFSLAKTNLWQPLSLLFLLFVYVGTLAVSSLFSFDSYYGILLTESDQEQRKGSIIREDTTQMFITARTSLDQQMTNLREGPLSDQIEEVVQGGIDALITNARNLEAEFERDARLQQDEQEALNTRIDERIAALRTDRERDVAEALGALGQIETLRERVAILQARRDEAQADAAQTRAALQTVQENINNLRAWADCEELGRTDGVCELAPIPMTGVPDCGSRCLGYRADATNLESVELPQAQRAAATAQERFEAADSELQTTTVRLEAAAGSVQSTEGAISPAAQRARDISDRYDAQIAELEEQKSLGLVRAQQTGFDIGALSAAYAAFKSNPGPETLSSYDTTCRTTRDTLLRIGVQDASVREFDCQPAAMSTLATQANRVQNTIAAFDASCGSTTISPASAVTAALAAAQAPGSVAPTAEAPEGIGRDTPTAPGTGNAEPPASAVQTQTQPPAAISQSAANDDASLRRIVDRTRACLAVANLGQTDVINANRALTELESTYLSDSPSIRRAVNDLVRGNGFAIGAASAAVFVDVLILFVGLLVAMSRDSTLYDNPLNPQVMDVEDRLSRTAAWYAPDQQEATGMRIFFQYLQQRYLDGDEGRMGVASDEIYRTAIDPHAVRPEHKRLVNAVVNALPARYKRTVKFRPLASGGRGEAVPTTAINGTIVSYIARKAHQVPEGGTIGEVYDLDADDFSGGNRGFRALRNQSNPDDNRRGGGSGSSLDDDLNGGKDPKV